MCRKRKHRRRPKKKNNVKRLKIKSRRQIAGIGNKEEVKGMDNKFNFVEKAFYKELLAPTSERGSTYRGLKLTGKIQHFFDKVEATLPGITPDSKRINPISEEDQFDYKILPKPKQ